MGGVLLPTFEFELDALMPKKFVDREDLLDEITKSLHILQSESDFFEIFAIFGMGGIGKSRFLAELKYYIYHNFSKKIELIYVALEVDNDNSFHSLLRIRKSISQSCYLFDYALIALMDSCLVEKINEEFLSSIRTNLTTNLISLVQDTIPIPLPSLDSIVETLNTIITKLKKAYTKEKYWDFILKLEQLVNASPKKLLNSLPSLLGYDLGRIARSRKMVVILDSCCNNNNGCDWLNVLLSQVNNGLYILTSRERLALNRSNIKEYRMQEIPAPEAKKYLEEYIDERHQASLIPQLILSTECIPIYLDLAVSIYLRCKDSSQPTVIDQLSFSSKEEIVRNFLDHLPDKQQEVILALAVVGVFDSNIFNHLISDLNFPISQLDYYEICRISLVDNLNIDCDLKTFHNIFQRNICKILPQEIKYKIFQSYLSFLSQRGIFLYPNEILRIYFLNVLRLVADNKFKLTIGENERILDLFFTLRDQRVEYTFAEESLGAANRVLSHFFTAVALLHSDVTACLSKLAAIKKDLFLIGKHKYSYDAIKYYSWCIIGQYNRAKSKFADVCNDLHGDVVTDWYYGKLKIYYADCLMLTGDFRDAIIRFDDYYDEIEHYANVKENDIFEIKKQKGHCYRLNFLLEKASAFYSELFDTFAGTSVMKSYAMTSLCEAKCFFSPQYVIDHYQESLKTARGVGQTRSCAKIYYSAGIAYTVKRDFSKAREFIRKSIKLNERCNYPAGKLFALIAKCYYFYAKNGNIPQMLVAEAEKLSAQLQVYGYLLLPIYIMQQNNEKIIALKEKYQWLDWEQTEMKYNQFIQSLSN